MKMVNFHLLCHGRLLFNHCVEQVLKKLKFFAFSIKRHWRCLDWSDGHRLWFILQIDHDVGQSVQRVLRCFRYLWFWSWQIGVQRDCGLIVVSPGLGFSGFVQSEFQESAVGRR